jgi:hypothetical protein
LKIIALLLLLLVSVVATAQEKPQETEKTVTASEPAAEPRVDDGSIKLFLDKIEVVGQLEKPQAVFIIPGSPPKSMISALNVLFLRRSLERSRSAGRSSQKHR